MSHIEIATGVVPLTDKVKSFLKAIQLNHEIPENAEYIAFFEDGNAMFLAKEDFAPSFFGGDRPTNLFMNYYENIKFEIED